MRNVRVVTSQVGWHHLVSTGVLRLSWCKPQLHRPIPLCSQALSGLSPKLLWFSQSYTPALLCWHLSHPKTALYPGHPESQPGKIRKQWACLSCHPLGSLQALVHAARGCNLVTHLWEGHPSSSTQGPWKTRVPDAQIGRRAHQGEPRPSTSPLHPTPIHSQLSYVRKGILEGSHKSPTILLALRHFHFDIRVMPMQSTHFDWIIPIKQT